MLRNGNKEIMMTRKEAERRSRVFRIDNWDERVERLDSTMNLIVTFPTLKGQREEIVKRYLEKINSLGISMESLERKWVFGTRFNRDDIIELYNSVGVELPPIEEENNDSISVSVDISDKNSVHRAIYTDEIVKYPSFDTEVDTSTMEVTGLKPVTITTIKRSNFYSLNDVVGGNLIDLIERVTNSSDLDSILNILIDTFGGKTIKDGFGLSAQFFNRLVFAHQLSNVASVTNNVSFDNRDDIIELLNEGNIEQVRKKYFTKNTQQTMVKYLPMLGVRFIKKENKYYGMSRKEMDDSIIKSLMSTYDMKRLTKEFPLPKELAEKYPSTRHRENYSSFSDIKLEENNNVSVSDTALPPVPVKENNVVVEENLTPTLPPVPVKEEKKKDRIIGVQVIRNKNNSYKNLHFSSCSFEFEEDSDPNEIKNFMEEILPLMKGKKVKISCE